MLKNILVQSFRSHLASMFAKSANMILKNFLKKLNMVIKISYNWEVFDRKEDLFTGIVVFQF